MEIVAVVIGLYLLAQVGGFVLKGAVVTAWFFIRVIAGLIALAFVLALLAH